MVRSDAAQSAFGPSGPNALMSTCTSAGLSAGQLGVGRSRAAGLEQDVGVAHELEQLVTRIAQTTLDLPRLYATSPGRRRAERAGLPRAARR